MLPPTAGFWVSLLIIEGLFPYAPQITTVILVTFAVLGWTLWDEISRPNDVVRSPTADPAKPACGAVTLIPSAAVLVCISLFPTSVLSHIASPSLEAEKSASLSPDSESTSAENRNGRSQVRASK